MAGMLLLWGFAFLLGAGLATGGFFAWRYTWTTPEKPTSKDTASKDPKDSAGKDPKDTKVDDQDNFREDLDFVNDDANRIVTVRVADYTRNAPNLQDRLGPWFDQSRLYGLQPEDIRRFTEVNAISNRVFATWYVILTKPNIDTQKVMDTVVGAALRR